MPKKRFKLSHSLGGIAALLIVEGLLLNHELWLSTAEGLLVLCAIGGSLAMLYVATEIIEEVRSARHMLMLLSALVGEFVIFFAFQYWFLLWLEPQSFAMIPGALSLLLQSTMVFVFNPMVAPTTLMGQALLLINTLASLGLVLFILQNVWQFRRA